MEISNRNELTKIITAITREGTAVKVRIGLTDKCVVFNSKSEIVDYATLTIRDKNRVDEIIDDLYDLPRYEDGKICVGEKGYSAFYAEAPAEFIGLDD